MILPTEASSYIFYSILLQVHGVMVGNHGNVYSIGYSII